MRFLYHPAALRLNALRFLGLVSLAAAIAGCDSGGNSKPPSPAGSITLLPNAGSDKGFVKLSANKWRLVPRVESSPVYWTADYQVAASMGKKLTAKATISSTVPAKGTFLVARADWSLPWEGTKRAFELQPNQPQALEVSHEFKKSYPTIKLQFIIKESSSPNAELTIDDISLSETPTR